MACIKTLLLEVLILANYHWYGCHSVKVDYTIGALLSGPQVLSQFNAAVNKTVLKIGRDSITFTPISKLMATNALKAAEQVCKLIEETHGRMFVLMVSHPPEYPDMPPLSASFTCAFYHLPVIGVSARQSAFSDKYSHSSFLRTVPPYSQEAQVWADLIRVFQWKEVSVIYSDDQEGKTLVSRLEKASDDAKYFKITRTLPFNADEDEDIPINFTQILTPVKNEQTRAVLLYARREFAQRVFDTAQNLSMLGKEWAWIVTEQALQAANIPQGVIGVRLAQADEIDHVLDAVEVATQGIGKAHSEDANDMAKLQSVKSCNQDPNLVGTPSRGRRSALLWLDYGKKIYKAMTSVLIGEGRTGRLEFDNRGDRVLPVYDIVNVQFAKDLSNANAATTGNLFPAPQTLTPGSNVIRVVGKYGIRQVKPPDWDLKEPFLDLLSIDMGLLRWPGNVTMTKNKEICIKVNERGDCVVKDFKKVPAAPISFKKKTKLRVVTKESIPFVYARKRAPNERCKESGLSTELKKEVACKHTDPRTGVETLYCCSGYCIDLLRRLANRTGIEENFTPFTYDLHLVGDGDVGQEKMENDTKEWTGMVGELISGMADLAVAPMTITPERASRVEFTKPFKYLGLTILVKQEKARSNLASFLQPFENTLWVLVGLSVHVVALVLYLLDRFSPFGRFKLARSAAAVAAAGGGNGDNGGEEEALDLSSAMWFAWGVLLNSGIGEGTPRSFSARVLGMVWAGFAMIIVASYTANLAAFLVLDRPEASISGIDDARLRNPQKDFSFATVRGSPVEMYFKRQVEYATMYRTMETMNYNTPEEAIRAVKSGKLKAFIWDSARLNYEASMACDLVTAGEVFGRNGYGLAMKKDNPWLYEMSQAVLNFHERGFMETLDTQWILLKSEGCEKTESSPATLGLTNMAGVFIMVAAGIVAGVFLIFIEIAYKKRRGLKEKELELAKNAADRWRGNIEKRKILRKTLAAEREALGIDSPLIDVSTPSANRKRANPNGLYTETEGQV